MGRKQPNPQPNHPKPPPPPALPFLVRREMTGSPLQSLLQKPWQFEQKLNYQGKWALATDFKDRREIQMCIMSSELTCDYKVKAYLELAEIWEKHDLANNH